MPLFKAITTRGRLIVSWQQQVVAASLLTTYQLFANPATSGEVYDFKGFDYSYDVASTSGTIDIRIVKATIASTAGVSAINATLPDLSATARTARKGVITTTGSNRIIMPGSMLTMIMAGTLTNLVGFNVAIWLTAQRGIRTR